jgi:hypothetical protein
MGDRPSFSFNNSRIHDCGTGIRVKGYDLDMSFENSEILRCKTAINLQIPDFDAINAAILKIESNDRDQLRQLLEIISKSTTKRDAIPIYDRFCALAANHTTILQPFIPSLITFINTLNG